MVEVEVDTSSTRAVGSVAGRRWWAPGAVVVGPSRSSAPASFPC